MSGIFWYSLMKEEGRTKYVKSLVNTDEGVWK